MLKIKDGVTSDVLINKYGFSMNTISEEYNIYEYELEEKYSITLIQRGVRSIYTVIPRAWDTDCTPISDVVFKLIKDGLVDMV